MQGLEGTTLDHYYLERLLGEGGMAEVYLARDTETDNEVAVKVMTGNNANYLERFRREAEAVDKLNHPHILPAFDYGDQGAFHFLVMPYVSYGTLREILMNGPLSLEESIELLDQIADALQFAHDNGIIHRDIKPSNILVRNDHYVFLADFGLAKTLEGSSELTQSGVLLGTPEYMAPDLADGPATVSTDIYALGIVLYQMVTGKLPFVAETPVAVYWRQIRDQPLPPSYVNPVLSPAIDDVVMRALAKEPERRFATTIELAQAFKQAVHNPASYRMQMVDRRTPQLNPSVSAGDTETPIHTPEAIRLGRRPRIQRVRRFVPSGNPLAAPSAMLKRRRMRAAAAKSTLPPLPLRADEDPQALAAQPPVRRRKVKIVRPARTPRTNTAIWLIVALGLLLIIGLPMSYIYYMYSRSPNTVNPGASSINAPTPAVTATQQVQVQAQATQQSKVATAISVENQVTGSTPLLTDRLASNTQGHWPADGSTCVFTEGSYRVNVKQSNYLQLCTLQGVPVDDTAVQVDVSLLSGSNAGVLFRINGDRFYDFEINSLGQFFFRRHDAGAGATYQYLIKETPSSAILPGGQKNTLLLIANGSNFKLYINTNFVGEVNDDAFASGQFALAAGTLGSMPTGTGSFNNLKLFKADGP